MDVNRAYKSCHPLLLSSDSLSRGLKGARDFSLFCNSGRGRPCTSDIP